MKDSGNLTKDTDRALIGRMRKESYEENTLEIGFRTNDMEEALFSIKLEIDMMVSGS